MTTIRRAHSLTPNGASARKVGDQSIDWTARVGLCAWAFTYLLIGVLALLVAAGHSSTETDQWGAFQQINRVPFGHLALWAVAFGLAAYSLWRFSEVITGAARDGKKAGPRFKSFVTGCIYGSISFTAFDIAAGKRTGSQAGRQQNFTARVMQHAGGRWAVAIAGAIVVVVGGVLAYQGVTRKFEKYLRMGAMSESTKRTVTLVGTVGTAARGIVFAVTGLLLVEAATQYKPSKAAGLDGALRSLRDTSAGPWLLGAAAAGLIAFGIYGFAEARWRAT